MTTKWVNYRSQSIEYPSELAEDLLAVHGHHADILIKETIDLYLDHGVTIRTLHIPENELNEDMLKYYHMFVGPKFEFGKIIGFYVTKEPKYENAIKE